MEERYKIPLNIVVDKMSIYINANRLYFLERRGGGSHYFKHTTSTSVMLVISFPLWSHMWMFNIRQRHIFITPWWILKCYSLLYLCGHQFETRDKRCANKIIANKCWVEISKIMGWLRQLHHVLAKQCSTLCRMYSKVYTFIFMYWWNLIGSLFSLSNRQWYSLYSLFLWFISCIPFLLLISLTEA